MFLGETREQVRREHLDHASRRVGAGRALEGVLHRDRLRRPYCLDGTGVLWNETNKPPEACIWKVCYTITLLGDPATFE